ncbi:MAG: AmpG family muropeptide MFS transporter, partial [Rhodospirillaceae bacterium]|nr:AmpG family muropeptide MFS transporter [Rhodospirillaceae bacterium]
ADHLGWTMFFLATIAAAVPGLVLLVWLIRRQAQVSSQVPPATSDGPD